MNLNQNAHFARAPHADIRRSRFDMSSSSKFTMSASELVPFFWEEILPGDTFEMDTSILARMQTLTVPLMDEIYLSTTYFFVPNRLLWKHWAQFCGESDEPWYDETEYSVPQIEIDMAAGADPESNTAAVKVGTVADYLGCPPLNPGTYTVPYTRKVNHLPFRAYVKIFNDWWRNENVQDLATFNTEDTSVTMNNAGDAFYGGTLLKANKMRDRYTTVLPKPQKGPEVTIGVGDVAPVFAATNNNDLSAYDYGGLRFQRFDGENFSVGYHDLQISATSSHPEYAYTTTDTATIGTGTHKDVTPINLMADISQATGISINELRMAFATQRFYELSARSGSRYIEILESMFGVTNGDARLQRSEFLGGNMLRLNINQAIQNSETATTPLGNIGAYSLTVDNQNSFTKSFTEHGILMGICVIRYPHSYSQGYEQKWLRKDKFDYYWPMFQSIGEQPVTNLNLYAAGSDTDDEVFGYNEAWVEYRTRLNTVMGEMRPTYAQTLDFWHLGDYYTDTPVYSPEWIVENPDNIDRALAVSGSVADQFLVDIHNTIWATRPMPLYSVPGLDVM